MSETPDPRDFEIKRLTEEREKAENAAREAQAQATQAIQDLQQKYESALEELRKEVHIPDLETILNHCRDGSCAAHAKQLQDFITEVQTQFLNTADFDTVEKALRARGWQPKTSIPTSILSAIGERGAKKDGD